jgi:hypothetical protein
MPTWDDQLEENGQPELFTPPPGQNIELDQEAPIVPGDRFQGAKEFGTTNAEERIGEPIADRVRRETPDFSEADIDTREDEPPVGRLLEPDSDVIDIDGTAEAIALMDEDDSAGLSAEESAMHIVGEDEAGDASPAEEAADYLNP